MEDNVDRCQRIGRYIAEIHRASGIYFTKRFNKFGIGSGQCLFLLTLYDNNGMTQEKLTKKLKLDKATTARAIKKLEDEGYVKRIKKEDDRRAYNLMITEKAEEIKEEVYSIMNEWESMIKNCIKREEAEELLILLGKLANSSLVNKEDVYE